MTTEEEKIPVALWEGTFRIFGMDVRCAVLDTGQRVVNGDDFVKVLSGNSDTLDIGELKQFMEWQEGTGIPDDQKTN